MSVVIGDFEVVPAEPAQNAATAASSVAAAPAAGEHEIKQIMLKLTERYARTRAH